MLKLSQHDARHAMNMWEKWQKEAEDLKSLNKELAVALEETLKMYRLLAGPDDEIAQAVITQAEAALEKARGE